MEPTLIDLSGFFKGASPYVTGYISLFATFLMFCLSQLRKMGEAFQNGRKSIGEAHAWGVAISFVLAAASFVMLTVFSWQSFFAMQEGTGVGQRVVQTADGKHPGPFIVTFRDGRQFQVWTEEPLRGWEVWKLKDIASNENSPRRHPLFFEACKGIQIPVTALVEVETPTRIAATTQNSPD